MKKLYTLLFLGGMVFSLNGQVADRTETDCSQNSRSIHQVLGEGKVLIIASKGLDCSICMGHAPQVEAFAAQNVGSVEVWGAMTMRYSGAVPTCTQVNNWANTYNWQHIFAFVDQTQYYYDLGTPRYYVYDPRDSSEAYNGFSWNDAKDKAEEIASASLSTPEVAKEPEVEVFAYNNILVVDGTISLNTNIEVIDLTGKPVYNTLLTGINGRQELEFNHPGAGIYLVRLSYGSKVVTRKVMLN